MMVIYQIQTGRGTKPHFFQWVLAPLNYGRDFIRRYSCNHAMLWIVMEYNKLILLEIWNYEEFMRIPHNKAVMESYGEYHQNGFVNS